MSGTTPDRRPHLPLVVAVVGGLLLIAGIVAVAIFWASQNGQPMPTLPVGAHTGYVDPAASGLVGLFPWFVAAAGLGLLLFVVGVTLAATRRR